MKTQSQKSKGSCTEGCHRRWIRSHQAGRREKAFLVKRRVCAKEQRHLKHGRFREPQNTSVWLGPWGSMGKYQTKLQIVKGLVCHAKDFACYVIIYSVKVLNVSSLIASCISCGLCKQRASITSSPPFTASSTLRHQVSCHMPESEKCL